MIDGFENDYIQPVPSRCLFILPPPHGIVCRSKCFLWSIKESRFEIVTRTIWIESTLCKFNVVSYCIIYLHQTNSPFMFVRHWWRQFIAWVYRIIVIPTQLNKLYGAISGIALGKFVSNGVKLFDILFHTVNQHLGIILRFMVVIAMSGNCVGGRVNMISRGEYSRGRKIFLTR